MPTILVIRNTGVESEIVQVDGHITEFAVTGDEPITLLHKAHLEIILANFSQASGQIVTEAEFLALMGIADNRPKGLPTIGI